MRPGTSGEEVAVRPQAGSTGSNRDSFTVGGGGVAEVKPYRGWGGSRTGSTGSNRDKQGHYDSFTEGGRGSGGITV